MVIHISETGQNVEPGQQFTIPSLSYTPTSIPADGDTLIFRDNAGEFMRPIRQNCPPEDGASWDDSRAAMGQPCGSSGRPA
ncbi:hypothetical protein ACIQVR_26905 [Streptomyces xanthochromogenes]|uniref:hypothetical protein n=1 Tax=Streptomyces xanthochromogenes TaxID=67384 RepID=UPI0037FEF16C